MTARPLRLVIFDCDGVLIDSEPLSRDLLVEDLAGRGLHPTEAEFHSFVGLSWSALKLLIEDRFATSLPADWALTMQRHLIPRLQSQVTTMSGARDLLLATQALGLPYRIASNSSHEEMQQKFGATGLLPLVHGRMHSARDVARGKPAPELFLAAAAAEGVSPGACLVVEDSVPGVAAAHAAGMQVIAFAPDGFSAAAHAIQPHRVVASLAELPDVFRTAQMELC